MMDICIHLNEEIVNLFIFFAVKLFFFFDRADVAGNLFWTEKTLLARWTDRNNRQKLCLPGLGNIFWPFFFEFSKVNVLKINLMDIFLIYASVNLKRIFQHLLLIYASINHNTNLATPVWRRILLSHTKLDLANISHKEHIFYFHRIAIKCI